MTPTLPSAQDVKVFVPAMNFAESVDFYCQLGWTLNFRAEADDIAELELAEQRFYLQNYYQKDWANNFMMHITVDDAEAWFDHARAVIARVAGNMPVCKSLKRNLTVHALHMSGTRQGFYCTLHSGSGKLASVMVQLHTHMSCPQGKDCCLHCSYVSMPCPPVQQGMLCSNKP